MSLHPSLGLTTIALIEVVLGKVRKYPQIVGLYLFWLQFDHPMRSLSKLAANKSQKMSPSA